MSDFGQARKINRSLSRAILQFARLPCRLNIFYKLVVRMSNQKDIDFRKTSVGLVSFIVWLD